MKIYRMALGLLLAFALSFGARADIPLNHGGGDLQSGAFSGVTATNPNTGDTQAGQFSSIPTTTPVGTLVVTNQAVDCGVPAGAKGTVWGTSSSYPDWVFILWDAGTTNTISSTCSPTLVGATLTTEQKARASWVHWNQVDVTTTTTTTTHGIATSTPVGTRLVTNQAVDCGVPAGAKGTLWGTSSSYPDWVFVLWDAGTTNTIASSCTPVAAGATLTTEQKARASWVHWNQVDLCSGSSCTGTVAATLSSLSISCPSTVAAGGYGSCAASAYYSDGSSKAATNVQWSVAGSGATIGSTGTLSAASTLTADTSVTVTATFTDGSVTKTASAMVTLTKLVVAPSSQAVRADCVFSWGERIYPELFSPSGAVSKVLGPYYYRYYSKTNSYLGISTGDEHLIYVGLLSGNSILDLGLLSTWQKQAGCQ
ncbi:MAG: hypothetical protein KGZ83_05250 [Sulfuricella sp.]|nr:hypothetical protein [Sulfuricella sp.]